MFSITALILAPAKVTELKIWVYCQPPFNSRSLLQSSRSGEQMCAEQLMSDFSNRPDPSPVGSMDVHHLYGVHWSINWSACKYISSQQSIFYFKQDEASSNKCVPCPINPTNKHHWHVHIQCTCTRNFMSEHCIIIWDNDFSSLQAWPDVVSANCTSKTMFDQRPFKAMQKTVACQRSTTRRAWPSCTSSWQPHKTLTLRTNPLKGNTKVTNMLGVFQTSWPSETSNITFQANGIQHASTANFR